MVATEKLIMGMAVVGVVAVCAGILAWPRAAPGRAAAEPAPVMQSASVSARSVEQLSDWEVSQRKRVEGLISGRAGRPASVNDGAVSSGQIGTEYCGTFRTQGGGKGGTFHVWIYPDDTTEISIPADQECSPPLAWVQDGKTLLPTEAKQVTEAYYASRPEGEPWYPPGQSPADEARREAEAQALMDRQVKEMLAMEDIQRRGARGETIRSSDIDWR